MITLPARPESLTFAPQQSALIVVDMQNAYASGAVIWISPALTSPLPGRLSTILIPPSPPLAAGMLIIWFQNGWDDQYVEAGGPGSPNYHKSNALKTMRQRPELQGKLLAKGGWDYQLVDELTPQEGDIVLPKPRYSGFFNTPLDSIFAQPRHTPRCSPGSPPTSASNRRCAMASFSNTSASCWRMPPIRPARPSPSRRRCSILKPFSAGSATSRASATRCPTPPRWL